MITGLAAPAAYLAVIAALLGHTLFAATALTGGDWTALDYPFYRFSRDTWLAEGRLPFWNPAIFCGMPHLVALNSHVLYPTELLAVALHLPAARFYAIDVMLHLWLGGWGFYGWQRSTGAWPIAAWAGGLGYMLGGHVFGLVAVGIPWLRCLGWLPWIVRALESGRSTGRPRSDLVAGGLQALCLSTAGMQFTAFTLGVAAGWILFTGEGSFARRAIRFGALLAPAAGLAAVIWLPALEYYVHSVRVHPELFKVNLASQYALPSRDLLSVVRHGALTGPGYEGFAILVLAGLGALVAGRAQRRWLVLAVVTLFLAMGPLTPVGRLLTHLPIFSGFRGAVRWFMFDHLILCVLMVGGIEAVRAWVGRQSARGFATIGCATLGLFGAADLILEAHRTVRTGRESDMIAADPVVQAIRQQAGGGPVRVYSDESIMTINGRMQEGIEWVFAYHGLPLSRFIYLYLVGTTPPPLGNPRMLDALNTRFIVASRPVPVGWPRVAVVATGDTPRAVLLRNPAPAGYAFLAASLVPCVTMDQVIGELRRPDWTVTRIPTDSDLPADLMTMPMAATGRVEVVRGRDEMTARARLPRAGMVVFSEPWYPAWCAFLDGRRVPIYRAYGALRMVAVPAGDHLIRMTYDSWLFKAGLWITLGSLAVGVCLIMLA